MKNFLTLLMFVGLNAQFAFAQDFAPSLRPECDHRMYGTYLWTYRPTYDLSEDRFNYGRNTFVTTIFEDLAQFFQDAETITITYFYNSSPDTEQVHLYSFNDEFKAYPIRGTPPEWVVRVKFDTTKVRLSDDVVLIGMLEDGGTRTYMAYRVPIGVDFKIGSFTVKTLVSAQKLTKDNKVWRSQDRILEWGSARDPKDVRGEKLANNVVSLIQTMKRLALAGGWSGFTYKVYGKDTTFTAAWCDTTDYISRSVKRTLCYEVEYTQAGKHVSIRSEKGRRFYSGRVEPGVMQNWAMSESGTGTRLELRYPLPYMDKRLLSDLQESANLPLIEEVLTAISRCCKL